MAITRPVKRTTVELGTLLYFVHNHLRGKDLAVDCFGLLCWEEICWNELHVNHELERFRLVQQFLGLRRSWNSGTKDVMGTNGQYRKMKRKSMNREETDDTIRIYIWKRDRHVPPVPSPQPDTTKGLRFQCWGADSGEFGLNKMEVLRTV
jgi:hypothetical protein